MTSVVRRHPFWSFYVLALLIAGAVVVARTLQGPSFDYFNTLFSTIESLGFHKYSVNIITIAAAGFEHPIYFGIFVFAGAPTMSALVITAIAFGRPGLKKLLGRFRPWRDGVSARQALPYYAVIVLFYLAVMGGFAWITLKLGGAAALNEMKGAFGASIISFILLFLAGAFLEEGGTLEELGWRGFALPMLMDRMRNPLRASLFLAVLWLIWHLPREVPGLIEGRALGEFFLAQLIFLIGLVSMSLIITYFFNKTGGSVIPAIMIHGLFVHCSRTLNYEVVAQHLPASIDLRVALFVAVAIVLVWITGPALGSRHDEAG